ncbi:MAG: type II toxin-antitoxin system prevent-host-death family antitoxin [Planctomycetota bacterium]
MRAITCTEAKEKLDETIERVCEDHDPVTITKRRHKVVVMIPLDEYESLTDTSYLFKSPRNAKRIRDSIKEIEEGRGKERKLIE